VSTAAEASTGVTPGRRPSCSRRRRRRSNQWSPFVLTVDAGPRSTRVHLERRPTTHNFHSTGAKTIARILDSGVKPDAVVAFADTLALAALAALQDRGLRAPEDVLLIGFDNIDEANYSRPPLSTIDPDVT
jgi:DNA-binding LacI/PurR family transcriptional regulator